MLKFFSGGYITDEWARPCITIPRLYCWKGEDKAVPRMDHKGQRNIFNLHAGYLELIHSLALSLALLKFVSYKFKWFGNIFQLCGVRGNANVPAKALFWQPRKGLTFLLTFESEQERNAAIALSRKYAYDCNVSKTKRKL